MNPVEERRSDSVAFAIQQMRDDGKRRYDYVIRNLSGSFQGQRSGRTTYEYDIVGVRIAPDSDLEAHLDLFEAKVTNGSAFNQQLRKKVEERVFRRIYAVHPRGSPVRSPHLVGVGTLQVEAVGPDTHQTTLLQESADFAVHGDTPRFNGVRYAIRQLTASHRHTGSMTRIFLKCASPRCTYFQGYTHLVYDERSSDSEDHSFFCREHPARRTRLLHAASTRDKYVDGVWEERRDWVLVQPF